jgi:sugar phosphate isomerase/epimerase
LRDYARRFRRDGNEKGKRQVPDPQGAFAGVLSRVQVNAPFQYLVDGYLELFLRCHINPEIGFDASALDRRDELPLERTARLFMEYGRTVTLHGPFMDLAPGALDEKIREVTARRLLETMELVPLFRPLCVVFHVGYDDRCYNACRQEWLARSLATWEPVARRAEELGVTISLENVYEQTPEMIIALLDSLSARNVGFCLDVGHQNAFSTTPLKEWLKVLGPRLREVHLHDNSGRGDDHEPIGSGSVAFPTLFAYLVETGLRPVITLEPHTEASLWKSLEALERLWPWVGEAPPVSRAKYDSRDLGRRGSENWTRSDQ